jgi:hypothetical protein
MDPGCHSKTALEAALHLPFLKRGTSILAEDALRMSLSSTPANLAFQLTTAYRTPNPGSSICSPLSSKCQYGSQATPNHSMRTSFL